MKSKLLICMLACSSLFLMSMSPRYPKIVDQSGHKAPSWVNSIEKNYIIVAVEAESIEEAKEQAVLLVKQRIANSIADKVSSESTYTTIESDDVVEDSVNSTIRSKAMNTPLIKAVTLSKANDSYWELIQKSKDVELYTMHVKYPFSSWELDEYMAEYEAQEAKIDNTLKELESSIADVESVEDIAQRGSVLRQLSASIDPEDSRRVKCDELLNRYYRLFSQISVIKLTSKAGEFTYQLELSGRAIGCHVKPRLLSNCATNMVQREISGGLYRVTYDSFNCYEIDDNYIELRYSFEGGNLKQRIAIGEVHR